MEIETLETLKLRIWGKVLLHVHTVYVFAISFSILVLIKLSLSAVILLTLHLFQLLRLGFFFFVSPRQVLSSYGLLFLLSNYIPIFSILMLLYELQRPGRVTVDARGNPMYNAIATVAADIARIMIMEAIILSYFTFMFLVFLFKAVFLQHWTLNYSSIVVFLIFTCLEMVSSPSFSMKPSLLLGLRDNLVSCTEANNFISRCWSKHICVTAYFYFLKLWFFEHFGSRMDSFGVCVIGPPGSGKTVFCGVLARTLKILKRHSSLSK